MMNTPKPRRAALTVAAFAALVMGVYFVAQMVVLSGFDSVDRAQGCEEGLGLRFALRAQVLQLEDVGPNWADWTQAFEFVSAKTPAQKMPFQREELSDTSLSALDCDLFCYLSTRGDSVFAVSIDHKTGRTLPAPAGFLPALRESGLAASMQKQRVRNSIVQVDGKPLLISIQRVHRSGRPDQWNGAIAVGRWVGTSVKKSLQDELRLPVVLNATARGKNASRQEEHAADLLNAGAASSIFLEDNGDTLEVKTPFSDPRGRTALWATTLMPRAARTQGQASLHSFFLALLGLAIVSVTVALSLQFALSRAGAEQQRERDTFDLLARHLPDRLFVRDLNGGQTRAYGNAPGASNLDWLDETLPDSQKNERAVWLDSLCKPGERAEHEWDVADATWLELVTPVCATADKTRPSHLIGAAIDISSRKRAEREKDVLLKEIHHRVKNNLQIVVSLLNLQSDTVSDPQARAGFEDARARVRSMALIHEQLYRQTDLSHVDFGSYLQSLLQLLTRSYRQIPVRLETQIEPLPLDIDIAVPCGLIVTELVSNAFKHAFGSCTPDAPGNLCVRLCPDGLNRVCLQIEDNGPGLPDDFCLEESDSLGLQIVDSLATQISADVEVTSGNGGRGTRWTLRFEAVESSHKRIENAGV